MLNKIGARLTATFGAVLVLLLAICVTVSLLMARMNANTQTIVKDRAVKVALANQFKEGAYLGNLWAYRALDGRIRNSVCEAVLNLTGPW
jgi:methyl-accepting chemotaxis protein